MKVVLLFLLDNEEKRIARTLEAYNYFFAQKKLETGSDYELLVAINGSTDNTPQIAQELQQNMPNLRMIVLAQGGKGFAIAQGFKDALTRPNDLIGFVDADMATSPQEYIS